MRERERAFIVAVYTRWLEYKMEKQSYTGSDHHIQITIEDERTKNNSTRRQHFHVQYFLKQFKD